MKLADSDNHNGKVVERGRGTYSNMAIFSKSQCS